MSVFVLMHARKKRTIERERERREAQTLKNSRWDVKFCVEFKGQSLRVVFTIGRKNGQKQLLKVSADAPLSGFTLFPPPFLLL